MNRKRLNEILRAAMISIMIGFILNILMGGTIHRSVISYLWSAGYSVSIGIPLFLNGFIYEKIASRFVDWIRKPYKSLAVSVVLHLVYTSIVIFLVNWFWFVVILNQEWVQFWTSNKDTIIALYVVFIIISSIIYAAEFFKSWRIQVEETEKVKSEALALQYKVLQEQINPHFLFNSLNILGSLIDLDTEKAKTFTRELSLFYREVLQFKDLDIIALKEEFDFVKRYIYLQQIRFGEALQVDFAANENLPGMVIPLSLQALVENAIKHNEISKEYPLKIIIAITDDHELIVENNIRPKQMFDETSGTGLQNLAGRYQFLTGREVVISKDNGYFRVILPLIMINQ